MKYDLNNIDYESFSWDCAFNSQCTCTFKKKHLRANHVTFVTEEFRKAVMKRVRLRNVYVKKRNWSN